MSTRSSTPKHTVDAEIQWLPLSSLEFDEVINRKIVRAQVHTITSNFDPDQFGVLDVWMKDDDRRLVLGGQHRVLGCREMGWNDGQTVPCKIHRGLTINKAKKIAIGLNATRRPSFTDNFIRRVGAEGEETATAINQIVESLGLVISMVAGNGHITAAQSLENVYTGKHFRAADQNPEVLRRSIRMLMRAFGKDSDALKGVLIEGVAGVFFRYGHEIDDDRLVEKLSKMPGGPTKVLFLAKQWHEIHNGALRSCVSGVLVDVYNRGTRLKKITPWAESQ